MVDVSREVLIALKLVPDKGNAAVLRDLAKVGVGAHQTITVAAENSAAAQAKAHKKAQADIVRESQNAARKAASEQQKLEKALLASAGGAIALAKGLAQVGLAGEKDAEKLLQGLVAIEGAFGVIKGGLGILSNIKKAQDAYTASVAATAVAQRAAGVAGAVGGAASAGGGLASAGMALAGGPVGIAVGAIVAAGTAALYFANETRKAAEEQEKKRVEQAKERQAMLRQEREDRAEVGRVSQAHTEATDDIQSRRQARRDAATAGRSLGPADEDAAANQQAIWRAQVALLANNRERDQITARARKATTHAEIQENSSDEIRNKQEREAIAKRLLDLEKQREQIVKQQGQYAHQMAQEQLDLQKQQLQTARQRIQEEEDKLKSAEEKFAELAPFQAARAAEAARKARAGQDLNEDDRKLIRDAGLGDIDDSVRAGLQTDTSRRARANGFEDLPGVAEMRARLERFNEVASDLAEHVTDTEALIAKIDKNTKQQAEAMADSVEELMNRFYVAAMQAIRAVRSDENVNKQIQASTLPGQ